MPTTPTYGLRYPLATAPPNVPQDLQNLAEDTDAAINNHSVRVVVSTSDIASPYTGMIVFSTSDNLLYRYNGTTWKPYVGGSGRIARYDRTVTSDTALANGAPVPFDTVARSCPLVTPSGAGNTTFSVSKTGWYNINTSVRQGSVNAFPYIYVAAGGVNVGGVDGQNSWNYWLLNIATDAYLTAGQTIEVRTNGITVSAEAPPSQSMFLSIKYEGDD